MEIPDYILSQTNGESEDESAGASLSKDAENKVLFKKAYDSALRIILRSEQCSKGLSQKLAKKGIERDLIEKVIEALTGQNYLNDERFAELYISSRIRHKNESPKKLLAAAINRGIDSKLSREKIKNILDIETEAELLLDWVKAHSKKIDKIPAGTSQQKAHQLKRLLKNESFSNDAIELFFESL